jgi:2,4-dienoyl-CoA reductase-like NADH-dependent reductase (Old Yellow Enzyme family)
MSKDHPALQPIDTDKLSLPNRATVAPMSRASTAGDGIPTSDMATYYRRYAAGGFALIITEGTYTDRRYAQAYPNQPGLTDDAQQRGWEQVVSAIHAEGGKTVLQLMHSGALSQHHSDTRAPSAIQPIRNMLPGYSRRQGNYPLPQAMNLAEIDEMIVGFTNTAQRAERAGFDGVEIHAANGYLLDQFLTEYTNNREDRYGGSVENRIRISTDIVAAIKSQVSRDFIVGLRLSQGKVNDFDYLWPGGLRDGEIIFEAVQTAGVDYVHFASEGKGFDHGCLTREGESLTRQARTLTGLPVIANGGVDNPDEAARILDQGHSDLVALGKGALVNPDWPQRLAADVPLVPFDAAIFGQGIDVAAQFAWEAQCSRKAFAA